MRQKRLILDACILTKGDVSNVFFDIALSGMVSLHWTAEIGDEFVKNWARIKSGYGSDKSTDYEVLLASKMQAARNRLRNFERMQPEWRVPGWDLSDALKAFNLETFEL